MTQDELNEAVALAKRLPRPAAAPPARPPRAKAFNPLAERAERLKGYGKRRGPKGRTKLCAALNCYPFGAWWKKAVEKVINYLTHIRHFYTVFAHAHTPVNKRGESSSRHN